MNNEITVTIKDGKIEGFLSSNELARREDITPGLIATWARRHKITPAFRIEGRYYFPEDIAVPEPWDDRRRQSKGYILRRLNEEDQ